jgi:hypothetical protein
MKIRKRYLFFFVHPAKFHLSRITINKLIAQGDTVDIIITGRDILEELVINEGWKYTKIFPNGRKIQGIHIYISAAIYSVLTILKLLKITWREKYDFFISDDLLTFIGRIKRTPSIFVTDDDLSAVPESIILMISSNYILAPDICNLGKYNKKKLGYYGYKSIFHLHPNHFSADISKVPKVLHGERFFFIRTVSATSTHDIGKRGINNSVLKTIISKLEPYGRVVLNSERELPSEYHKYLLDFRKNDISHIIKFADLFISDSTTMCVESALLGVPSIEFDDWYGDFKQYYELNEKYQLLFGFSYHQQDQMLSKMDDLILNPQTKQIFSERKDKMLKDKIDASSFLFWILSEYPESTNAFFEDKSIQLKFK